MKARQFNSLSTRTALCIYRLLNYLLLIPLLIYLWFRSRKDKLYIQHLGERFGFYSNSVQALSNPVWIHAVSLGELRSAVPLIKALLKSGEQIITTHFTPVGRREAQRIFAEEISRGCMLVLYVPLEYHQAYQRFYKQFQPSYGLVMEVEFWPCMIDSACKHNVPLLLCNGQYPSKSYHRDIKGLGFRASLVSGFAGAMVKSDIQKQRFTSLGLENVAITGELRFDQPIPAQQITAANNLLSKLPDDLFTITIASAVEGEDDLYIDCIKQVREGQNRYGNRPILFVYVPRAPERFIKVKEMLTAAGLNTVTRTELLDADLSTKSMPATIDVLLGDSMGEMYFYLQLSQQVIVGGGFSSQGAHNISEAFALSRPVFVGPTLWTIEYPATEALQAGVLKTADNAKELRDLLINVINGVDLVSAESVDRFFTHHTGAINKTLNAIPELLAQHRAATSH